MKKREAQWVAPIRIGAASQKLGERLQALMANCPKGKRPVLMEESVRRILAKLLEKSGKTP